MSTVMLTSLDQLSHYDQVLVSLILKNTKLGEELIERVLANYLAIAPDCRSDLAHYFVDVGHLARTEMYRLVKARNFALLRKEDKRIARRAIRKNLVSRTKVEEALVFQKQLFKALGDIKRLHEIFIDDGTLTKARVAEIWSEYREYLHRRGERPAEARTDPLLLKKQG